MDDTTKGAGETTMKKTLEEKYRAFIRAGTKKSGAAWQAVREITTEQCSGERSPYQKWASEHSATDSEGAETSVYANAKATPELEHSRHFDATTYARNAAIKTEVVARVRKLMDMAKQVLTEQQYNVFILTMVKDPALTYREAGKVLGISFGRVRQLADTLRAKLEKAYNERT